MTFWTSEKLLEELRKGDDLIPNPDERRVKCGAYELSMGPEYFVTSDPKGKRQYKKQSLKETQQFVIPPGQFALLLTEEKVSVPLDAIAFISVRFGKKVMGLVNVSGFHVDPGFKGRLKFAVYNAGSRPIPIERGEPVFLIWFSSTDRKTTMPYKGNREDQYSISTRDVADISGEVASPAQLNRDLENLKRRVNLAIATGILIISGFIFPLVRAAYERVINGEPFFGSKKVEMLSAPK